MTRLPSLHLATTALMTLSVPAFADISAEDVWQNLDAALLAFGGTSEAELARDGNVVTVSGHIVRFDLPMGIGQFWTSMGDYRLVEANGAVSIVYPEILTITAGGEITGEGSGQLTMEMYSDDIVTLATGDPGAISYISSGERLEIGLIDVSADGVEGLEISGTVVIDGFESESRIVEDSLIVLYSRSSIGETVTSYEFTDGQGLYSENRATAGPTVSTANLGMIPGGADLLNLTQALRDGMYITLDAAAGESQSYTLTRIDGDVMQEQTYSTDASEMTFRFDREALDLSGTVRGLIFNMTSDTIEMPSFGFDATEIGMGYRMPLLADTAPQDFGFGLSLQDLRIGPTIWALFDPGKVLPREPASLEIAVNGEMTLGADLPDLLALAELGGREEVPIQVTSINIAHLFFSGLGITADSAGRFDLDYGDLSMIPGMPWPRGSGRADVEGLDGAIDRFVELGLIGSEEVLGLRMIISLGTIVSGDDKLTSEIEFTEDGGIIANGQQLR